MNKEDIIRMAREAGIDELRQALETEQEPVAWRYKYPDGFWRFSNGERVNGSDPIKSQALYTSPPNKEWVGLTDEEIHDLIYVFQKIDASNSPWFDCLGFYRAVEQALKEKNHG